MSGAGAAPRAAAVLLALGLAVQASRAAAQDARTDTVAILGGRLLAHRYLPAGAPRCPPVLLLSGDGGWELGVVDWARRLQEDGHEVVGVDAARLVRLAGPGGLAAVVGAWERLRELTSAPPVLLGYSRGATLGLALAVLARDPPDAVLLGTDLSDTFGGPAAPEGLAPGVRRRLGWTVDLRPLYRERGRTARSAIIPGRLARVAPLDSVRAWFDSLPEPKAVTILPRSGHGFADEATLLPHLREAIAWAGARACGGD